MLVLKFTLLKWGYSTSLSFGTSTTYIAAILKLFYCNRFHDGK
jgi:hypothetical protein